MSNNGAGSSTANGRLGQVEGTHVHVERSAVRMVDASQARLEQAAVQRLRAGEATVQRSAVAYARFEQGTVRQSTAGIVAAKSVACDEVRTLVLASPVVRGEVHTWLDLRSAVAIGVGMALGRVAIAGVRALARRAVG